MELKILGTGCAKCIALEKATIKAVNQLNIDADVSKVEDIIKIMEYGVMTTPALIANNKILVKGRVPSVEEIKSLLTN
jgi:small redox-active disulfide protein 2